MSENQLNSIQISQQPQFDQQNSRNENNFTGTYTTYRGQQVAQEIKTLNEEGEMNMSQYDYEGNCQPMEGYVLEKNSNFQEDKRIVLQNEEGQISNNTYYSHHNVQQSQNQGQNQLNGVSQSLDQNFDKNANINGQVEQIQVKILDDGYNYEPHHTQQNENGHNDQQLGQEVSNQQQRQEMNGTLDKMHDQNYMSQNTQVYVQNLQGSNYEQVSQQIQPQINNQQIITERKSYNSYVQAVLNNPINPSSQPSHQALQQIYNQLKLKFPQCMPQQIILLLYNNLIKIPRQEMIQEQGQHFDQLLKYDGGRKYFQQVSTSTNKGDMYNYELRKQMVKIYVTKGYGLKVYQQHMLAINPNAQPIDKEKFKSHFVNIYKTVIKRVEEFLSNTADRQFQPITRKEFHMTLGDVINCRKHYSPEFCEVFFKLIQATFDPDFDKDQLPNQGEVIFFYRTILGKVRQQKIILAKKMYQPEQEKDTDIWSEQFQHYFIKLFILQKNIFSAKIKLIQQYPECEGLITDEKLKQKIENAIRAATRWLQVQNQNCGNQVTFIPSDVGKRFIMRAPQLQQSRIKLLKVYVKKPKDPQVLSDIANFINKQLRNKYDQQKIPQEVLKRSIINQVPRNEEKSHIQKLIKAQIMRNA